jgi:hypothetical protein
LSEIYTIFNSWPEGTGWKQIYGILNANSELFTEFRLKNCMKIKQNIPTFQLGHNMLIYFRFTFPGKMLMPKLNVFHTQIIAVARL